MKSVMKVNWKVIGIGAAVAGALAYPALRLVKFISAKIAERKALLDEEGEHRIKAFSPAYRGKHKPHHRHANGHGPETA
jgi:hypothetical protein